MKWLQLEHDDVVTLPAPAGRNPPAHVFSRGEIDAVNAAIAAGRPLLLRGEPGVGKSQLAKAAAFAMQRAFVPFVVDARTEAQDLLWHFDAVARLAEAQLLAALGPGAADGGAAAADAGDVVATISGVRDEVDVRERLRIEHFVEPRALWWGFDWLGATERMQAVLRHRGMAANDEPATATPLTDAWAASGCDPSNGTVVLIDEIDKGESDVPNGLLDALGSGEFRPPNLPAVAAKADPLVLITTNNERALPDAFLRRCLVLHLRLPEAPRTLRAQFRRRGRAHFPDPAITPDATLLRAARLVVDAREKAKAEHLLPLPGQAEFLDLVQAVTAQAPGDLKAQSAILKRVSAFALNKQADAGL
jgi:MoxR-like ATPase